MSTVIFDVELRLNTNSKVYQHFLKKVGGSEFNCNILIKKTFSEVLEELLEKKGGEGDG